jgi:ABC-2 type transport system ATP-binding protein
VETAEIGRTLSHLTQFDVSSLTSTPPTLEELFLRHYGDELAHEQEAMETTA